MKRRTKALLLSFSAVLLVVASVLGTMAYLTDKDSVVNTFTVGQVKLKLDEAKVDDNGDPVDKDGNKVDDLADAERVKANNYHLLPGHTYTKDPTVTVLAGSEKSYVRMMVTVKFEKALDEDILATGLDSIFIGYDAENWNRVGKSVSDDNKSITYEFRYKETVSGKVESEGTVTDQANELPALFTGFTIPGEWNNATMAAIGKFEINVTAHAIQADGFDTAEKAWGAFDNQMKAQSPAS